MTVRVIAAAVAAVLAVAGGATGGFASPRETACIDDWSVATQIVKREKLTTVEELASQAQKQLDGAIVRTALCRDGARYVYRLVIRKRGGEVSRREVDARKPF